MLHRRDRPSRGERENPVLGVIAEYLPMGESVALSVGVDGTGRPPAVQAFPSTPPAAMASGRAWTSAYRSCARASTSCPTEGTGIGDGSFTPGGTAMSCQSLLTIGTVPKNV